MKIKDEREELKNKRIKKQCYSQKKTKNITLDEADTANGGECRDLFD